MATVAVPCSTSDGQMVAAFSLWETTRGSATANNSVTTTTTSESGQSFLSSGVYYIDRSLLVFDLAAAGVPANAVVTAATLNASVETVSGTGEVVHLVTAPTSVATDNFAIAKWGAVSAGAFPASMTANQRYSVAIDLSKLPIPTTTAYIGLRGANDLNNTTPAGVNRYRLHSQEATTAAYRPTLDVTYRLKGGAKRTLLLLSQ